MATASSSSAAPATLIAYDCSGSTGNSRPYHTLTQQIVTALPPTATILGWDSTARILTHDQLKEINRTLKGFGGTSSEVVAQHCRTNDFHGHLVIITDGQVDAGSVDRCGQILGSKWEFASVAVHLIETGGTVNMSVSCPFTRRSPHQIFLYRAATNYERVLETQVSQDDFGILAALDGITTLAEYNAIAATLETLVRAATMGTTGDPKLRDTILAMKARINASQAHLLKDASGPTISAMASALSVNCVVGALNAAQQLTDAYYADTDAVGWSAQINRLVSMCEGALRGAFDLSAVNAAIHSDVVRRAAQATATPATAAATSEPDEPLTSDTAFVCPITMDAEADVVLLIKAPAEPVLAGLDKDIVAKLIECPLNALHYPEVVARFLSLLDHPISLKALKDAEESGHPLATSPFSRAPLLGAICLSAHPSHVAATNWTLARAIAEGKRVGSADMWFAVLWHLLNQPEAPAYLHALRPAFAAHMKWRCARSMTSLALTGQPELPTTRVPLLTAVWYVLASPALALPPKREAFRAHATHLEPLFAMLDLFGLPLPDGVRSYAARLQALSQMLWARKGGAAARGLPEAVWALTQCALPITHEEISAPVASREEMPTARRLWVPIDGAATADQVEEVKKDLPSSAAALPADQIAEVWKLADPSKSMGDIVLPFTSAGSAPAAEVNWPCGLTPFPTHRVPLCAATCRPFLHCQDSAKPWEECATALYGEMGKSHSCNELFGRFVEKYGAYPTEAEFLLFLYNREVRFGRHRTLPAFELQFIGEVFAETATLRATLTPAEFVARWTASRPRVARAAMEATAATSS